jgi:predicted metal-dependent phosphotriesterase family hydrolase
MAAVDTGAAIALHSPRADALKVVLETLMSEGFDPTRLVWVHAQESSLVDNLELASRGVTVSLDAIGTSDDLEMLNRIETLTEAGGRVVLSSDSTFVVHPAEAAYQRDITYLDREFAAQIAARCGRELVDSLRRENVLAAYGHPTDSNR